MDSLRGYHPTDLKQKLSDSHEPKKLHNLFMQAPAAIALLEGPQHIYTLANPAYQNLFNRTEEQLIGKTPGEVFPELNGQAIDELFSQVYHTNKAFNASEYPITFNDGGNNKTGYYNFVIQPIQNSDGKVSGLWCMRMR